MSDETAMNVDDFNAMIDDLGKILGPLGLDRDAIRQQMAARRAKNARRNARAASKNADLCRRAIGKTFTIRTSKTATITGVITDCKISGNGRAEVYLLQSGKYRHGPYYVRQLPR